MDNTTFAELSHNFIDEMNHTRNTKNSDYSEQQGDALASFKELSLITGIPEIQCWMVLATKHMLAIRRYAQSGCLKSESIHGRFIDLANYALLGDLLVKDGVFHADLVNQAVSIREKLEQEVKDLRERLRRYEAGVKAPDQSSVRATPEVPSISRA